MWLYQDGLSGIRFSWSKDSRWIAYPQDLENRHTAIALYDTKEGKSQVVTSGYYDDDQPVFDPDGKYLYYTSGRSFNPIYSDLDETWIYANTYQLVSVALRKDVPSPLAPRNDDEGQKKEKDKEKDKKQPDDKDRKKDEPQLSSKKEDKDAPTDKSETKDKSSDDKEEKKEEKPAKPVEIDLTDFERRAVVLPVKPGHFADLAALGDKLIYRQLPRTGSAEEKGTLMFYDLDKREDKTILEDVDGSILAANGEKVLVWRKKE